MIADAPILGLGGRIGEVPSGPSPGSVAAANMRQLIQLRWIAVAGQTGTILLVHFVLRIPLPVVEMLGVAALLAGANLLALLAVPRHRVHDGEVMGALLIDMAALTLQLYFSGGATNPFISLYLLQVVLGAILLPAGPVVALVAVTCLAYALLSLRNVPLTLPAPLFEHSDALFAIGHWAAFVVVASLLVRFITRISRNLRARDAYVADLRRHAAEEEGIVRMGLFASGAAHELGTPLGTLSVILGDWRRMPQVAGDPELSAEVEEMQAEVRRCKTIVSDILHSAGHPRGEAMERMPAAAFLDLVVAAWQPTQPQVPIDYQGEETADAVIAVDPALRQAVWNLLDNAAEASPAGIRLAATKEDNMLVIAVSDWGDGFAPDALANLGKLFQSTKGAGHGLGLFLATNVARRLGGRIEACNRVGGGAEVRLLLPLATQQRGH